MWCACVLNNLITERPEKTEPPFASETTLNKYKFSAEILFELTP